MNDNHRYIIISLLLIIQLFSSNKTHAQTSSDSLMSINCYTTSDSLSMKPSKAPIIAFGVVGALLGGAIGGAIYPPK